MFYCYYATIITVNRDLQKNEIITIYHLCLLWWIKIFIKVRRTAVEIDVRLQYVNAVTYRPISTSSYPPSCRHIDGKLGPSLMTMLTASLLMTYPAPPAMYPCGMFVKKWWPTYTGLLLLNWARNLSRFSQITYLKSAVHVLLETWYRDFTITFVFYCHSQQQHTQITLYSVL